MKKIFLIVLLALIGFSASARKSYITVEAPSENGASPADNSTGYIFILTGDVPNDIEGFEYKNNLHLWYSLNRPSKKYSTGEILILLSEYGYEVEYVIDSTHFLLSKEIPSSGQTTSKGDVNTDGEVNIADVNEVINLILGFIREHPSILEQIKK